MSDGAIDERVLLARQPILDREERVIAYELLYRPIPLGGGPLDPVAATASVIVNGLSDVGLDALVGPHPAYVNVTREFLLGVPSLPLAPERVVLELLEDQELDDALLDVLQALVDAGFTIALDDFQYAPEQEPLVELAAIAKLDVRALSPERLAHDAALLKGRGLRLVAEKVETYEEAAFCKALGFDAFQGYYFARPGARPRPPAAVDADHDALPAARDGLGGRHPRARDDHRVRPRAQPAAAAAEQLGGAEPRDTRALAAPRADAARDAGDPPQRHDPLAGRASPTRRTSCSAPRSCGRGWPSSSRPSTAACPDRAFTVGLFSLLGALVRQPLPDLLAQLPFDERTTAALLHGRRARGSAAARDRRARARRGAAGRVPARGASPAPIGRRRAGATRLAARSARPGRHA